MARQGTARQTGRTMRGTARASGRQAWQDRENEAGRHGFRQADLSRHADKVKQDWAKKADKYG
jgi:hypothetical protein